jgi:hypothetical protein
VSEEGESRSVREVVPGMPRVATEDAPAGLGNDSDTRTASDVAQTGGVVPDLVVVRNGDKNESATRTT